MHRPAWLPTAFAFALTLTFASAPAAAQSSRETATRPATSAATPAAGRDIPTVRPELASLLDEIRARDTGQLAVSEEDGRFLRLMIATSGAKRALEIGGASGYSAIWIAMGLRDTGGRLVTIEYDPGRAKELAANVKRAGFSDIVTVLSGDAFKHIPQVQGTFDFVFLDAWKRDYKRFFDLVFPRLEAGGLFVGHNVVNKRNELDDFLATVTRHPQLLTSIVSPSGEGMSVSYKRK